MRLRATGQASQLKRSLKANGECATYSRYSFHVAENTAIMVIGLLTIAAIPTVTGVAEGVSQQRKVNEEKSEEKRMAKFNLNVYCEESSGKAKYLSGKSVVLRNEKASKQTGTFK